MSFSLPVPAWLKPTPDSEAAENIRKGSNPWVDAVHLLWSIWLFFDPLFNKGFTLRWAWTTAVSYPIFLLFYALCITRPQKTIHRYAWGIALLATVMMPLNSGAACCYFIYGCVMIRACDRRLWAYLLHLVAMCLLFGVVATVNQLPWQLIVYMIVMVAAAWSGVGGVRLTPFGRPVVPDV